MNFNSLFILISMQILVYGQKPIKVKYILIIVLQVFILALSQSLRNSENK